MFINVLCILLLVNSIAQTAEGPKAQTSTREGTLKQSLQHYLGAPPSAGDRMTRYVAAFVDLNGDGIPEAVVYLMGQRWCGSGGCTMLVLARDDSSYRVITKIPITRLPIRVLTRASHGWRSLGVRVQGGGIVTGYEAELAFDGATYPENPSTPPARPLAGAVEGGILLSSAQHGESLYP